LCIFSADGKIHSSEQSFKFWKQKNLVSTGHVKGLAVAFQLQTGEAKLHTFGTTATAKLWPFFPSPVLQFC
jgi:hypothetical protein